MFRLKISLLGAAVLVALGSARQQTKKNQEQTARDIGTGSGRQTFAKYCASCHGMNGKGSGPAAVALQPQPADLTTLALRHKGKYPAGYVGALLKFGKSLTAHGSEDMPVWGSRFRELDPVHDPTGQQHVDAVVTYVASLQAK